jgi:hypothetical protein
VRSPERKCLTEAAGLSGCAGVKLHQQLAFAGKRQGPGGSYERILVTAAGIQAAAFG